MRTAIEQADRQFLEQLHRLGPATIQEICDEMGVTATAVRQRLVRLQERGLVSREAIRTGRGRPHHNYEVTEAALRELGDNYADLAMILWREITSIEEPQLRMRLLSRIREALVERYGRVMRGVSLGQRFDGLRAALKDHGFDIEVDRSGALPILRENNCPYLEIAASDPAICELEQSVFEKVLGAPLKLKSCCLDGHHCCEFEPAAE